MKIAIVGSGISGLVAAYRLQKHHEIHIFEANDYLGGHTNTIEVEDEHGAFGVDTGFIVFNDRTYPNFQLLLNEWGVPYQKTEMTFSMKCRQSGLEYRGADFNGLFAQRKNLFNRRFLRLLYDLIRFKKVASPLLNSDDESETVGAFLKRNQFSNSFVEDYFLPMGSAIWSCPTGKFYQFPIRFIAEFYDNHGLLGIGNRPQWFVIKGGSKQYVERLRNLLDCQINLGKPVRSVLRTGDSVNLITGESEHMQFDHAILACHADQSLKLLGDGADNTEKEVLSEFPYQKNVAVLHTQEDVLPVNRRAWAAWNYCKNQNSETAATVTYNMNILQSLEKNKTYCVSLNAGSSIKDENVIREIEYAHPIFGLHRKTMQKRHCELINRNCISFCGAYWGNGFHEDGVNSALAVSHILSEVRSEVQSGV